MLQQGRRGLALVDQNHLEPVTMPQVTQLTGEVHVRCVKARQKAAVMMGQFRLYLQPMLPLSCMRAEEITCSAQNRLKTVWEAI